MESRNKREGHYDGMNRGHHCRWHGTYYGPYYKSMYKVLSFENTYKN